MAFIVKGRTDAFLADFVIGSLAGWLCGVGSGISGKSLRVGQCGGSAMGFGASAEHIIESSIDSGCYCTSGSDV